MRIPILLPFFGLGGGAAPVHVAPVPVAPVVLAVAPRTVPVHVASVRTSLLEPSPRQRIAAFLDKQTDDEDDCTCTDGERESGDCDCEEDDTTVATAARSSSAGKKRAGELLGNVFGKVSSTNTVNLAVKDDTEDNTNPGEPLNTFKESPSEAAAPMNVTAPTNTTQGKSSLELELEEVLSNIARLRQEIALWSDHDSWNAKIAADKAAVEKETTPGLADMLADIRYEMHQLAVPTFVEVLAEKIELLQIREKELQTLIEQEKVTKKKGPVAVEKVAGGEDKAQSDSPSWLLLLAVFFLGALCVLVFYNFESRRVRSPPLVPAVYMPSE